MKHRISFCTALFLSLTVTGALMAQASQAGPTELDRSAGFGTSLDSGRLAVAVDLAYFHDAQSNTLVVNPYQKTTAMDDLEATELSDGRWLLPDGSTPTPVFGEEGIVTGDEPIELLEENPLPTVHVSRVSLVSQIAFGARKFSIWRECTWCLNCPSGCINNSGYHGEGYLVCKRRQLRVCRVTYQPVCQRDVFECNGCQGDPLYTVYDGRWSCGDC